MHSFWKSCAFSSYSWEENERKKFNDTRIQQFKACQEQASFFFRTPLLGDLSLVQCCLGSKVCMRDMPNILQTEEGRKGSLISIMFECACYMHDTVRSPISTFLRVATILCLLKLANVILRQHVMGVWHTAEMLGGTCLHVPPWFRCL